MKIGIIGGGMMGANLASLWARAGHSILLSCRHPEKLDAKVADLSGEARAVTVTEAMDEGEVLCLAVPFAAVASLGETYAAQIEGKVVLDVGNVFRQRDGEIALTIKHEGRGSGRYTATHFVGARVVKAFNTIFWKTLAMEAHREGARVGVPLASDDDDALQVAEGLVRDAGFEPIRVGSLDRSLLLDPGSEVWNSAFTVAQIRASLGLGA